MHRHVNIPQHYGQALGSNRTITNPGGVSTHRRGPPLSSRMQVITKKFVEVAGKPARRGTGIKSRNFKRWLQHIEAKVSPIVWLHIFAMLGMEAQSYDGTYDELVVEVVYEIISLAVDLEEGESNAVVTTNARRQAEMRDTPTLRSLFRHKAASLHDLRRFGEKTSKDCSAGWCFCPDHLETQGSEASGDEDGHYEIRPLKFRRIGEDLHGKGRQDVSGQQVPPTLPLLPNVPSVSGSKPTS